MGEVEAILRFTLLGLGTGSLYALGGLGIVAVHRGSRTLNFAHGGLVVWGAFLFGDLRDSSGLPAPAALAAVVAAGALAGAVIYLVVIRPIRHAHPLTRIVATLGVLAALIGSADVIFEGRPLVLRSSLPIESIRVFGQQVGRERLILLGVAMLVAAALQLWSARSKIALATRAMAEHEIGAQALGASPHLLGTINWALGCALATASGALIAPIVGRDIVVLSSVLVFSLTAALPGRFDSFGLALAGGVALGVTESLVTHWANEILPDGYTSGWASATPVILMIVFLLVRRDPAANRLPAAQTTPVATGPLPLAPIVGGFVALGLAVALLEPVWVDALTISMCFAVLALSLVVLIGFANQISLAQMSIAGLGAFGAARLSISFGLPFEVAPLAGALVGCFCGVLVGAPALRIRGPNLAVVTIGLGLAISNVLFANARFTGGFEGLRPGTPTVFGVDVDAATNPTRYAWVTMAWLSVAVAVVAWFRTSKLARRLLAVRANERATASLGISVTGAKLAAFALSSALAGGAGVLLSFRQSSLTFGGYGFIDSINLVVVTVIGGVGSTLGAMVAGLSFAGGVGFRVISELEIGWLETNYQAVFGVVLVFTVLRHPAGLTWRRTPAGRAVDFEDSDVGPAPARLEVSHLGVTFGGVVAVDDVSFEVAPGEVVGLVGPNGAGKTTLLDGIGGFAAAHGAVMLDQVATAGLSADQRARLGIGRVFQAGELLEDLSVGENLLVATENLGDGRTLSSAVRRVLEEFRIETKIASRPGELNGAERRAVALARTLAGRPRILLLDEPGAGLSITGAAKLALELRRIARDDGLGVLLVDHDMTLVMAACDRIVVLANGAVLASGTPAEISADPSVRDAYLGSTALAHPAEDELHGMLDSVGHGEETEVGS